MPAAPALTVATAELRRSRTQNKEQRWRTPRKRGQLHSSSHVSRRQPKTKISSLRRTRGNRTRKRSNHSIRLRVEAPVQKGRAWQVERVKVQAQKDRVWLAEKAKARAQKDRVWLAEKVKAQAQKDR